MMVVGVHSVHEPTSIEFEDNILARLETARARMNSVEAELAMSPSSLKHALATKDGSAVPSLHGVDTVIIDGSNLGSLKRHRRRRKKRTRRRRRRRHRQRTKPKKRRTAATLIRRIVKLPRGRGRRRHRHRRRRTRVKMLGSSRERVVVKSVKYMIKQMITSLMKCVDKSHDALRVFAAEPWRSDALADELRVELNNIENERTKSTRALHWSVRSGDIAKSLSERYRKTIDQIWAVAKRLKRSNEMRKKSAQFAVKLRRTMHSQWKPSALDVKQNAFVTLFKAKQMNIDAQDLTERAKRLFQRGRFDVKTARLATNALQHAARAIALSSQSGLQALRAMMRRKDKKKSARIKVRLSSARALQALDWQRKSLRTAQTAYLNVVNMRKLKETYVYGVKHKSRLRKKGKPRVELITFYRMALAYVESAAMSRTQAQEYLRGKNFVRARERASFSQKRAAQAISVATSGFTALDAEDSNTASIGDLMMDNKFRKVVKDAMDIVETGNALRKAAIYGSKLKKKKAAVVSSKKKKKRKLTTGNAAPVIHMKARLFSAYKNMVTARRASRLMRDYGMRKSVKKSVSMLAESIQSVASAMEDTAYAIHEEIRARKATNAREKGIRLEVQSILAHDTRTSVYGIARDVFKQKQLYLVRNYSGVLPGPSGEEIAFLSTRVTHEVLEMGDIAKSVAVAANSARITAAEQQATDLDFKIADCLHTIATVMLLVENQGVKLTAGDIAREADMVKMGTQALGWGVATAHTLKPYRAKRRIVFSNNGHVRLKSLRKRAASVLKKVVKATRNSERMSRLIHSHEWAQASSSGQIAYYEIGKTIRRLAIQREKIDVMLVMGRKLPVSLRRLDRGLGSILHASIRLGIDIVRARLTLDNIDPRGKAALPGRTHHQLKTYMYKSAFALKSIQSVLRRARAAHKNSKPKITRLYATQAVMLVGKALQVVDWAHWIIEEHRAGGAETVGDRNAIVELDHIAVNVMRAGKAAMALSIRTRPQAPPKFNKIQRQHVNSLIQLIAQGFPNLPAHRRQLRAKNRAYIKRLLVALKKAKL